MDCLLRISKMIYKKHYHEAPLKFPETLNKLRTSEAWFPPKNRNGEPQKKIARSYVKRKVYQLSNVWAWNRKKIGTSKTGILKNKKECLSLKRGGGFLYGGIQKLTYFLNGIRKHWQYFCWFQKARILSVIGI